ncbi:hypothetical protein ABS767_11265 [Sphingomonas sp. ST-64]|uniref:Uncharacterized protein n=1 Tax=Sphingomonas plantiphila TaxID=3163295 RepID=A0ABW8YMM7_9SPHN
MRGGALALALAMPVAVPLVAVATPPERGAMMIVALRPASQAEMIGWAARADAGLLGLGPVPGTLIVAGRRDAILRETLRHGAVVLATSPQGCTGRNDWGA